MGKFRMKMLRPPTLPGIDWSLLFVVIILAVLPHGEPQFLPQGQTSSSLTPTGSTSGGFVVVPNQQYQTFGSGSGQFIPGQMQQANPPTAFQQDVMRQQRLISTPFMGTGQDMSGSFGNVNQGQGQGVFVQPQQPQYMVQPVFQQQSFAPQPQWGMMSPSGQQFWPQQSQFGQQQQQQSPPPADQTASQQTSDSTTGASTPGSTVDIRSTSSQNKSSDAEASSGTGGEQKQASPESEIKGLKQDKTEADAGILSNGTATPTDKVVVFSNSTSANTEKSTDAEANTGNSTSTSTSTARDFRGAETEGDKVGSSSSKSNFGDTQNRNQTQRSLDGASSLNSTANGQDKDVLSKSQLFSFRGTISDPTSLAALKSQVKLSRFQIWWLTNQILPQIKDNLRPDYVFMFPSPFQQGIPSINISQVMTSPVVRPEVVRALIDNSDGMLKSQLAIMLQRFRLSAPILIKDIMSSKDPAVILSMINPREMLKNIQTIIKTITEMPETGRFGITSVHAKLLPTSLLTTWLHFFNKTKLTGMDLLGQSPLGAANELQLAILGLTCADVRNLPARDIVMVVNQFKRELYNLRVFQPNLDYPLGMRRCILEKVLEYLVLKQSGAKSGAPLQDEQGLQELGQQSSGGTNSILDNLEISEIKAIGGEVLTAIPTGALKQAKDTIRQAIIEEIGRLDLVTLLTFLPTSKLEWLANQISGTTDAAGSSPQSKQSLLLDSPSGTTGQSGDSLRPRSSASDDAPTDEQAQSDRTATATTTDSSLNKTVEGPRSIEAGAEKPSESKPESSTIADPKASSALDDTATNSTDVKTDTATEKSGKSSEAAGNKTETGIPTEEAGKISEAAGKKTETSTAAEEQGKTPETEGKKTEAGGAPTEESKKISEAVGSKTETGTPKSSEVSSESTNSTAALANRERRRRRQAADNREVLDHLGSLYCYSSALVSGSLTTDKEVLRDFFDQKQSIGEKTCCLTKKERTDWSAFLKTIYGDNVTSWNEFDLLSMGDLLLTLTEAEINSIAIESLSRVATTIIRQSGLHAKMRQGGSVEKKSFIKGCISILDDQEGDVKAVHEFMAVHKAYMRKLAQAAQWMVSGADNNPVPLPVPGASNKGDLNITCDGLTTAGPAALGYTIADLKGMRLQELFDCIEPMGLLDWDEDTKVDLILYFKEKFRLTSQQLNILTLIEFGNLVSAIPTSDLVGIPLVVPGSLDTVAILGDRIVEFDTLKTLASKFMTDNHLAASSFSQRTPRSTNMRVTVRSMGNILCGFPHNILSSLLESDSGLFLETSPDVGKIQGCTHDSLALLASHAVRPSNYGPPETWSVVDVQVIGVVVAGLAPDRLSKIPPDSVEGLSALAIKSFPSQSLRALTVDQISRIPLGTALAMDFAQVEELSKEQKDTLKATIASHQDSFLLNPNFLAAAGAAGSNMFAGFGTVGVEDVGGEKTLQKLQGRSSSSSQTDTGAGSENNTTDTAKLEATRSVNETSLKGSNSTEATNGTLETRDAKNATTATIEGIDGSANNDSTTGPANSEGDVSTTPKPRWSGPNSARTNSISSPALLCTLLISALIFSINI